MRERRRRRCWGGVDAGAAPIQGARLRQQDGRLGGMVRGEERELVLGHGGKFYPLDETADPGTFFLRAGAAPASPSFSNAAMAAG